MGSQPKSSHYIERNEMSGKNRGGEHEGHKPEKHARPRRPFLKGAHRDWRVWAAIMLMVALMAVYVLTEDESIQPGSPNGQPMPANVSP
jgi:hypothetical protein